jgi:hypothetical protein
MYPAVAQMNTRWTSQPGADPIVYGLITPPQIPDRSTELRRIDRSGCDTVHFLVFTTLSPLGPGRPPRMPKHKELQDAEGLLQAAQQLMPTLSIF